MTMKRFRIGPPSRRQLLRKTLTLGVSLAVVPVTRTMATPVAAIGAATRQEVKFEERQECAFRASDRALKLSHSALSCDYFPSSRSIVTVLLETSM